MKKIIVTFVSALMLIACEKAAIDTTPTIEPVKGGSVTLKAIMPDFTSDTKASIADNGAFSWVVGTDVIAVRYVKAGQPDEYVPFTCSNAETCEFTGDPTEGYTLADSGGALAYYPYDYRGTPSDFSGSAADASKSFQMKATEIVDGKLIFQHDNALLKVTINNIPAIATSLVVGNSTLSLSEGGNLTVNVPVRQSSAAPLTISVKYGETALFTKSTSKEVAIQKGYIYTHIPTLTVAPEAVYFVRDIDGSNWTDNESTLVSDVDGCIYSSTVRTMTGGGSTRYFRFDVKYSDSVTIQYGNQYENVDGTSGGTFIGESDYAAVAYLLDGITRYTIDFNFVTGAFSYSAIQPSMYLIGSPNSWEASEFTTKSTQISRLFGDTYLWTGTTKTSTGFKLFEDGVTTWSVGVYPDASDGSQIGTTAGENRVLIYNSETNTGSCNDAFTVNSVIIKGGVWNNWGTENPLSKTSYPGIWKIRLVVPSATQLKFVVNNGSDTWSGAGSKDGEISMNSTHSHLLIGGGGSNLALSAGTYDIYFNDKIWHYYLDEVTE